MSDIGNTVENANAINKLTTEQAKLVEDNYRLIYYVINKMGVSIGEDEDWYGIAACGLCKAAQTYNPNAGFTFSTYAIKVMCNEMKMAFRKCVSKSRVPRDLVSSYNQQVATDADVDSEFIDIMASSENVEYKVLSKLAIERTKEKVSPRVAKMLSYLAMGYTNERVGDIMGCSHNYVEKMKIKFRELYKEEFY